MVSENPALSVYLCAAGSSAGDIRSRKVFYELGESRAAGGPGEEPYSLRQAEAGRERARLGRR